MRFTDPVTLREWARDAELALAERPLDSVREDKFACRIERLVEENLELRRLLETNGEDF